MYLFAVNCTYGYVLECCSYCMYVYYFVWAQYRYLLQRQRTAKFDWHYFLYIERPRHYIANLMRQDWRKLICTTHNTIWFAHSIWYVLSLCLIQRRVKISVGRSERLSKFIKYQSQTYEVGQKKIKIFTEMKLKSPKCYWHIFFSSAR